VEDLRVPFTWSVPRKGVPCTMTELEPSDAEYKTVLKNIRDTIVRLHNIVSVSANLYIPSSLFSLVNLRVLADQYLKTVSKIGQVS